MVNHFVLLKGHAWELCTLQLWACHTQEKTGREKLMSPSLPLLSTKKKNKQKQYPCLAKDSPVKGPSLPEWQERTINCVGSERAVATIGNKERTLCCRLWCHLFPGFLDVGI